MTSFAELKIPGTYNLMSINCKLTETHSQHETDCERKIQLIMTTKPELVSITASYLKKHGWPSNLQLVLVEKLLPEAFINWLEYMRKEEKRVGVLFPAIVKFSFSPHQSEYLDYGWDKKWFFSEGLIVLPDKGNKSKKK